LVPTPSLSTPVVVFQDGIVSSTAVFAPSGSVKPVPTVGTDYRLTQDSEYSLTLTYTKDFLQAYEHGRNDLHATINLYTQEGRRFKQPFNLKIRANTLPPTVKNVIVAKTVGQNPYYVLCLPVPEMEKRVQSGLLHKDLAAIIINGKEYAFAVNEGQTAFNKPEDSAFITASEVEKLAVPNAEAIPEGGWLLFYKTDVPVAEGAAVKTYTVQLVDQKGLMSGVYTASTNPNKPKPVTVSLKKGESAAEVNSDNDSARPHRILIDSKTKPATLHLACATAGAIIHYSLTETAGGVPPVSMTGSGSGVDLELPIPEGRTEADYKLEVRAEAAGFTTGGTRTLYYKVTAKNTNTALRELKLIESPNEYNAVLSGEENYICYIPYNGEINTFDLKATAAAPQAKITGVTVAGAPYEGLTPANSVTLSGAVTLQAAADSTVTVLITVTGEDTNVTGTYTLMVRYAPTLTGLEFKQNGNPVLFRDANDTTEEPFKPEKYEYHIFADNLTPSAMNFTYQAESGTNVTVK
ncbi:MAG: right-handed parallel beta-helix repeat-containing protein, partial [Treponema sp.]